MSFVKDGFLFRKSQVLIDGRNYFEEGPHLTYSREFPWGDEVGHLATESHTRFIYGK